jgi:hypothetical protein
MAEQVWYIYHQGQQLGPFERSQITQMVSSNMIAHDAFLFKVGWRDWRPLEESFEELGIPFQAVTPKDNRRLASPRASITGRVIVHNNGQLVIGIGVNISATCMFVETKDHIFNVGERLKLSVRADGFSKAFNVTAQVIRFNSDPRYPVGYGLRFEELDQTIAEEIRSAVDKENSQLAQKFAN